MRDEPKHIINQTDFNQFVFDVYSIKDEKADIRPYQNLRDSSINFYSSPKKIALICCFEDLRLKDTEIRVAIIEQMKAAIYEILTNNVPISRLKLISNFHDDNFLHDYIQVRKEDKKYTFDIDYIGWETLTSYATDYEAILKKYFPDYISKTKIQKYLNRVPAYNPEMLIGRKHLIRKLHKKLSNSKSFLLINGVGGIGKTSLVSAYINTIKYIRNYNYIVWVTVNNNLLTDFMTQCQTKSIGFKINKRKSSDENFQLLLDSLRYLSGHNLLVIDNANNPDEILQFKNDIESIRWKVIITSRVNIDYYNTLSVNNLSHEGSKELFYYYYDRERNDAVLDKLLEYINYHSLLIELLAKAAKANPLLNLSKLHDIIHKQDLKAEKLQGTIQIERINDENDSENKLYNYILSIFELDHLSDIERQYLIYFSVLPLKNINIAELFDFFTIKDGKEIEFLDTLRGIVKKGWIQKDDDNYQIHKLIKLIIKEKLKPDQNNCKTLINSFIEKLKPAANNEDILSKKKYLNYAQHLIENLIAYEIIPEFIELVYLTGAVLNAIQKYNLALKYLNPLLKNSKVISQKTNHVAELYRQAAKSYFSLENYFKSLEYNRKSINIKSEILPEKHISFATSYYNIATVYQKAKNYQRSLEYSQKALAILEKSIPQKTKQIADTYNQIAQTYEYLEQYDKAIEYCKNNLKVLSSLFNKNKPEITKIYAKINELYEQLKEKQSTPPNISLPYENFNFENLISESCKDVYLNETKKEPLLFALKQIKIRNYHGIYETELKEIPLDAQWIFLTGVNGHGKTALLQAFFYSAIGMFSTTEENEKLWESGFNVAAEFYRNGKNIINNLRNPDFQELNNVLAYGPSRLVVQSNLANNDDKGKSSLTYSLFNDGGILLNIENNLIEWYLSEKLKYQFFTVKKILLKLLPYIADIKVEEKNKEHKIVYYEKIEGTNEISNEQLTFNELASGYKSIMAMVGDMLLRFNKQGADINNPENLSGIVIVDEIDLHLHPKWQWEMPFALSEVFPKIQFIVSTHSIVPLLGAPENSVFIKVVRKSNEKGITIERPEINVYNLTPNTLFTSELFDYQNIIPRYHTNRLDLRTELTYNDVLINQDIDKKVDDLSKDDNKYPDDLFEE